MVSISKDPYGEISYTVFSIQLQAFEFIENFTLISNVILNNVFGEIRSFAEIPASIYLLS